MPVTIRKFIATLVKWGLGALMLGGFYFTYLVFQNPAFTQSFIPAILMVSAYFFVYLLGALLFILFYVFVALLLLSPFLFFLYWLIQRYRSKRAERAARQRLALWNKPFPLPPAAAQPIATPPERIPLLQRRFHY